ncbi:MAG: hypothetical protein HZC40_09065 [Chloroflexi bacterium]|nr:hypothetical protein [Chloroflexota bacterium]
MNRSFILRASDHPTLALCTIKRADCENLREWKNANRFAFFHQALITPEQQAQWFENYLTRAYDYMFIVQVDARALGCMGFRLIENHADVYYVILGDRAMGKRGWMRAAHDIYFDFALDADEFQACQFEIVRYRR